MPKLEQLRQHGKAQACTGCNTTSVVTWEFLTPAEEAGNGNVEMEEELWGALRLECRRLLSYPPWAAQPRAPSCHFSARRTHMESSQNRWWNPCSSPLRGWSLMRLPPHLPWVCKGKYFMPIECRQFETRRATFRASFKFCRTGWRREPTSPQWKTALWR